MNTISVSIDILQRSSNERGSRPFRQVGDADASELSELFLSKHASTNQSTSITLLGRMKRIALSVHSIDHGVMRQTGNCDVGRIYDFEYMQLLGYADTTTIARALIWRIKCLVQFLYLKCDIEREQSFDPKRAHYYGWDKKTLVESVERLLEIFYEIRTINISPQPFTNENSWIDCSKLFDSKQCIVDSLNRKLDCFRVGIRHIKDLIKTSRNIRASTLRVTSPTPRFASPMPSTGSGSIHAIKRKTINGVIRETSFSTQHIKNDNFRFGKRLFSDRYNSTNDILMLVSCIDNFMSLFCGDISWENCRALDTYDWIMRNHYTHHLDVRNLSCYFEYLWFCFKKTDARIICTVLWVRWFMADYDSLQRYDTLQRWTADAIEKIIVQCKIEPRQLQLPDCLVGAALKQCNDQYKYECDRINGSTLLLDRFNLVAAAYNSLIRAQATRFLIRNTFQQIRRNELHILQCIDCHGKIVSTTDPGYDILESMYDHMIPCIIPADILDRLNERIFKSMIVCIFYKHNIPMDCIRTIRDFCSPNWILGNR